MSTLLVTFHVLVCVILVFVVLIQAGKEGGLGITGGGSSQTVFGSSGGANFFTKFTSATAAIFMITSIALTLSKAGKKHSIFENVKIPAASTTTIPAPAVPTTGTAGNATAGTTAAAPATSAPVATSAPAAAAQAQAPATSPTPVTAPAPSHQ